MPVQVCRPFAYSLVVVAYEPVTANTPVVVAYVEVALVVVRLVSVEEAFAIMPPVKERSVEVAAEGNASYDAR